MGREFQSPAVKQTVDIDILPTSRNGGWKIVQSIRTMSRPPLRNENIKPVDPIPMKIYQSNTYRKDLSCLHFHNESRGPER